MLDRLESLEKQCGPLEDKVKENAGVNDNVKLMMSIPGVDFCLASLISSFIGDVNRFPSDDHLASFFDIVPTSRDSADVKRRGKMTKDGPSTARWTLSIIVDTVMQHNQPIKDYYQSVKKRTGSGKLAHVSTMRKLTRTLYHMLKTREHWRCSIEIEPKERSTPSPPLPLQRGQDRRILGYHTDGTGHT
jgi:transposase